MARRRSSGVIDAPAARLRDTAGGARDPANSRRRFSADINRGGRDELPLLALTWSVLSRNGAPATG